MDGLDLKYDGKIPHHLRYKNEEYKSHVTAKMWKYEIKKNIRNIRYIEKDNPSLKTESFLWQELKNSCRHYRHHWRNYLTHQRRRS